MKKNDINVTYMFNVFQIIFVPLLTLLDPSSLLLSNNKMAISGVVVFFFVISSWSSSSGCLMAVANIGMPPAAPDDTECALELKILFLVLSAAYEKQKHKNLKT